MNLSNNRPIWSFTSFLKLFENVMYSRLKERSNVNKILVEEQFGFGKNLATQEAT